MPAYPPPPCFIHVDLDGLWTLAGAYGYEEGDTFERDPVFEFALPRMLDLFDRLQVRATFFIVGRDLDSPAKRDAIKDVLRHGHDLGNHSFNHLIGLERLSPGAIVDEISRTQRALVALCEEAGAEFIARAPHGFRAPGYDAGPRIFAACRELGIEYDGSLLPTPWAPFLRRAAGRLRARVRRELTTNGNPAELAESQADFSGQYGDGRFGSWSFAPQWEPGGRGEKPLLRLPLAVSPLTGLPLHASLGLQLGERAVKEGLRRLARRGWPVTYLLHGLDAADPREYSDRLPPALRGSAAMNPPLEKRMRFLESILSELKSITRIQLTSEYLSGTGVLPQAFKGIPRFL